MENKSLLDFYKSEIFDSDLKSYLANELIGITVINKYYPEIEFNRGYDNTGIHWTTYLIQIIKLNDPKLYSNLSDKLNINPERIKDENLSLTEERIISAYCMRLLDEEERKILGRKLANITKYLIEKRKIQIEELEKNG